MIERAVDMLVCAVAPDARPTIILPAHQGGTSASQQLRGSAQAASGIGTSLCARALVGIFSVYHGGPIDGSEGRFHFALGLNQVARHAGLIPGAQQRLSLTQVAAGLQPVWMAAGCSGMDDGG